MGGGVRCKGRYGRAGRGDGGHLMGSLADFFVQSTLEGSSIKV